MNRHKNDVSASYKRSLQFIMISIAWFWSFKSNHIRYTVLDLFSASNYLQKNMNRIVLLALVVIMSITMTTAARRNETNANEKASCNVHPAPFTCDKYLGRFKTNACKARCWHNKWEARDDWCQRQGHYNYRWSFSAPWTGGKCYCCHFGGNSGRRC